MNVVSQYDEKSVLDRVARGDEEAFEVLFHQYRRKVHYFALKFLQSNAKAEDVLQEVFLKVWMNRDQLPAVRNFKVWLNAITRNYIFNALRKIAVEDAFMMRMATTDVPVEQRTALDHLSYHELENALEKAVSNLTTQQKKVFELSRVEGLKHDQIAEKLDISRDTVKKHMTDALRKIRLEMKPHQKLVHLSILLLTVKL